MIITKSKYFALKNCPLSFKFQYLDRRERDTVSADVTTIGLDLHNLFNTFFDSFEYSDIPENVYEFFCNVIDVPEKYKPQFHTFCAWECANYKASRNHFFPVMREQKVKALDMYGIVDRINFDGYNYSLIDYKSGFYDISKLRFELCFYKYLVDEAHILDKPIEYIGSYGYNKGDIFFEKVNLKSYDLMLTKIDAFRKIKFKEMLYPKKTGYHCRWCEYQMACSNTNAQTSFSDF